MRPGLHQDTMRKIFFEESPMSLKQRLGLTQEPLYVMDGNAFLFRGYFANSRTHRFMVSKMIVPHI